MKRIAALFALLLTGAISLLATQQSQTTAQTPPALNLEKVKENLYMITNGGGNTAAFITEKGVVVVDTKLPNNGPGILEKIKSVTTKPVVMVLNTHTHGDHVGSNSAFTGAVEFVAHENTKTNMLKMPAFQSEDGKKFLPGKTFKDKLTLLKGKEQIDLYYFGPGHTSGDALIVFKELKVMHAGDLFPGKSAPFMDPTNGGSGLEYPKTLAKALAGIKGVESIIPGHAPVMTWNDFKDFSTFVAEMVTSISDAKKAGKTADQAAADYKPSEKYKDYGMARLKPNVGVIYGELK